MIIWTPAVLSVLHACVLYFCICTCSAQLSMFHMESRSRNTLIIIIINMSTLKVVDLGSIPPFTMDLFPGRTIPVTSTLVLKWLPCQAHGVVRSALGLVDLVSV